MENFTVKEFFETPTNVKNTTVFIQALLQLPLVLRFEVLNALLLPWRLDLEKIKKDWFFHPEHDVKIYHVKKMVVIGVYSHWGFEWTCATNSAYLFLPPDLEPDFLRELVSNIPKTGLDYVESQILSTGDSSVIFLRFFDGQINDLLFNTLIRNIFEMTLLYKKPT